MPCPDTKMLVLLADGELDGQGGASVAHHVAACAACRAVVDELQAIDLKGRAALEAISVAGRNYQPLKGRPPRHWRAGALAAAAVAVLAISLAGALWRTQREAGPSRTAGPELASTQRAREAPRPPATQAAPLADEAYERWAAQHRARQIPLVPMEEVGRRQPHPTPPVNGL